MSALPPRQTPGFAAPNPAWRGRIAAITRAALAVAALLFTVERSQAQSTAAISAASVNLNQRAGPSTNFPVLQVVPAGGQVTLYGCIGGFAWCDGVHRGTRGWLSATYLRVWYQGQYITLAQYANLVSFPLVAFNLEAYWGRHYTNQPFYPNRAQWLSPGPSAGIQVGQFYNRLSPHGRWVWINGRYVWTPIVSADWRPYTDGRWVWNPRYGWTWVSNEPFGWATYHYGRWAYSHRIGWFWIPGTRWAPAWVSWRRSGDHIAWAPLPPDPSDSFAFGVSHGNIPNYYWQPVPANLFLSINLNINIIRDEREKESVIASTEEIGGVSEDENAVVNQSLEVEFVEQATQEEVVPVELALTDDPEVDDAEDGTVEIFTPPAEEAVAEAPEEVTPIELVETESETAGQAPTDQPDTEDQVPPPPAPDEAPPVSDAPPITEEAAENALPADAIESEELVCPEGSVLQDGECMLSETPPPPPPPVTEEPTTEGEPPPAAEESPPAAEQPPPPPAADEQAPPAAEEPPPPPPAAEEPPPPPAAEEPPPPPPAADVPPLPPAAEDQPPQPPEATPEECPEGYVQLEDGTCVLPEL